MMKSLVARSKLNMLLRKTTILKIIFRWFFEGEQDEELSKLEKLNNPSYICGHVFKPGEATYSCR